LVDQLKKLKKIKIKTDLICLQNDIAKKMEDGSATLARKHICPKTIYANPNPNPKVHNVFGLTKRRHFSSKHRDTVEDTFANYPKGKGLTINKVCFVLNSKRCF